jgi:hypothetical protein
MYDQSGSAINVTQATVARQPRIVNAGALDVRNGKAAPLFDGLNDLTGDLLASVTTALDIKTYGAVAARNGTSFDEYDGVVTGIGSFTVLNSEPSANWYASLTPQSVDGGGNVAIFNGVLQNVRLTHATGFVAVDGVQLGRDRGTDGRCWQGWIGEVVVFATQLSAPNYAALYTNQKTYWGTP